MLPRRVLWVDLDDLGWDLTREALSAGIVPSLAHLMQVGRTYHRFWAADVCSPFRARVMSGLDAYRQGNGIGDVVGKDSLGELPPEHALTRGLPGRSRHRGKWHLSQDPLHPIHCGFQEWSGNLEGVGSGGYWDWPKVGADDAGRVRREEHHGVYATLDTARDALRDLELGVDFVHVSFNAVHAPLHVPPSYPPGTLYQDGAPMRLRLQMLQCLDWFVGRLTDTATAAGYVTFVACDNGTASAGKNTLFERGLNTPFVIAGQGVIPGTSERLVQATDMFATIRLLRGLDGHAAIGDSIDSYPFLDDFLDDPGDFRVPPRTILTCDDFSPLGSPPNPETWRRALRDARWKLVRLPVKGSIPQEYVDGFFDLESDPLEQVDLFETGLSPEARVAYERLAAQVQVSP